MPNLSGRDLLSLADLDTPEIHYLLELAIELKGKQVEPLRRKILGLLFYKASTRTRVSFLVAMYQLGGQAIDLNTSTTQISRGEPLADTARVLDGYLDAVAIRTYAQADLETFAQYSKIPIINALSDLEHPCQVLADLLTIRECFGSLSGLTLTYLGDGNNMANSLLLGCALTGINIRLACPPAYHPDQKILATAKKIAGDRTTIEITADAPSAVQGSQILYTDVWASMGQESSALERLPTFQPYQLNMDLLKMATPEAIVLHCLPAHRDEEITEEVIDSPQSRIWAQAENRMHIQKAILLSLLGEG
jgi:ornithine carbamoyltransferase